MSTVKKSHVLSWHAYKIPSLKKQTSFNFDFSNRNISNFSHFSIFFTWLFHDFTWVFRAISVGRGGACSTPPAPHPRSLRPLVAWNVRAFSRNGATHDMQPITSVVILNLWYNCSKIKRGSTSRITPRKQYLFRQRLLNISTSYNYGFMLFIFSIGPVPSLRQSLIARIFSSLAL